MNETSGVPANDLGGIPRPAPIDTGAHPDDRLLPEQLLALLDRLGGVLCAHGDAVALLGLDSVGAERNRLDEHSDADFFVVVEPGRVRRFLGPARPSRTARSGRPGHCRPHQSARPRVAQVTTA